jgi:diaminopimelate decarboxylase
MDFNKPMFHYQHQALYCENTSLVDIARALGTPVYVYSKSELLRRARAYRLLPDALVCYAVKANGNPILLQLLAQAGLGADVTSGGELFLALQSAMPAERIIYSGVGKRRDEIEMALMAGIRALHVESTMELEVVAAVAEEMEQVARVAVRVNPNISAQTHPYDSTGRLDHKFGVPRETAVAILRRAAEHPFLDPIGLAAHIGSQITSLVPYGRLVSFLVQLANEMAGEGVRLEYLDVGGGLGIDYGDNETPPIEEWIETISQPVLVAGYDLVMEPGRSIVGPAGALLTEVLYTKEQGGKSFAIVDAGMNDLIRPAMYGATHPLWPVRQQATTGAQIALLNVVGPICETGDFLARERLLPQTEVGDMLALMQAGAYGFAMSSNYNGRLRVAEVLVEGDQFEIIRNRQTLEHLLDGVPTMSMSGRFAYDQYHSTNNS